MKRASLIILDDVTVRVFGDTGGGVGRWTGKFTVDGKDSRANSGIPIRSLGVWAVGELSRRRILRYRKKGVGLWLKKLQHLRV
jgi:hypothetical protein